MKTNLIEYETRTCEICHSRFKINKKQSNKTCSHKCSIEYKRRKMNYRSDHRIKRDQLKDNIDLKTLYERDHGICYICGLMCNYDDYIINDKGHFIVGPMYPSIEHTVPLSRGGLHSWENVRLAHFKCNWMKGEAIGKSDLTREESRRLAKERCSNKKEVVMYICGVEYMRFESTAQAAKYFNYKDKSIQNACRGEGTGCKGNHRMYGFEWYYNTPGEGTPR